MNKVTANAYPASYKAHCELYKSCNLPGREKVNKKKHPTREKYLQKSTAK